MRSLPSGSLPREAGSQHQWHSNSVLFLSVFDNSPPFYKVFNYFCVMPSFLLYCFLLVLLLLNLIFLPTYDSTSFLSILELSYFYHYFVFYSSIYFFICYFILLHTYVSNESLLPLFHSHVSRP